MRRSYGWETTSRDYHLLLPSMESMTGVISNDHLKNEYKLHQKRFEDKVQLVDYDEDEEEVVEFLKKMKKKNRKKKKKKKEVVAGGGESNGVVEQEDDEYEDGNSEGDEGSVKVEVQKRGYGIWWKTFKAR